MDEYKLKLGVEGRKWLDKVLKEHVEKQMKEIEEMEKKKKNKQ